MRTALTLRSDELGLGPSSDNHHLCVALGRHHHWLGETVLPWDAKGRPGPAWMVTAHLVGSTYTSLIHPSGCTLSHPQLQPLASALEQEPVTVALLTSASETSRRSSTDQLRGSPDVSVRMAPQASASRSVKMAPAHYSLRLVSWTDNLRSPKEVLRKVTCLGSCTSWARQKQSRGCWSS